MFIRTKTTPNSPRQSVQIVEGIRDKNGKVKQRIVHHVGVARDDDELEKLKTYGEELILTINPLESDADTSKVKPNSEKDFDKPTFPKEIYTSYDVAYNERINKENQKVVKNYFEKIAR